MNRIDARAKDQIRTVLLTDEFLRSPEGSVLIEVGNTKVICTAMVENSTARHLTGTGQGWITAEYAMLPGSTAIRKKRDKGGKQDGRGVEIQRLIGRSLRAVVDMEKLGERTIWIDCDVIQADGGTRTASITGAFVAMVEAMKRLKADGILDEIPITGFVSAVSVGIVDGEPMLDLCYEEDSRAMVDLNCVMTAEGDIIELQATGEGRPFTPEEQRRLIALCRKGNAVLTQMQRRCLGEL